MLSRKVQVSEKGVISGKGLVAIDSIAAGELIWSPDPDQPLISSSQRLQAPYINQLYSQVDADLFALNEEEAWCCNHSCDPNSMLKEHTTVAIRDIRVGEEVTYDYGLTEIKLRWSFRCHCGGPNCRHQVCNLDFLDARLRRRMRGGVPEHTLYAVEDASVIKVLQYRTKLALYRLVYRLYYSHLLPVRLRIR